MIDAIPNELQYRVLLCFLTSAPEDCTVMGISRTLQEEKYKISRALIALEKDGLVDRTNNRAPILTEAGAEIAAKISARINVSMNHLLYEGVDMESAKRDAFLWALYCTDKTIAVMSAGDERYRIKYELRDEKRFSGVELCKRMKDRFRVLIGVIKNGGDDIMNVHIKPTRAVFLHKLREFSV